MILLLMLLRRATLPPAISGICSVKRSTGPRPGATLVSTMMNGG